MVSFQEIVEKAKQSPVKYERARLYEEESLNT